MRRQLILSTFWGADRFATASHDELLIWDLKSKTVIDRVRLPILTDVLMKDVPPQTKWDPVGICWLNASDLTLYFGPLMPDAPAMVVPVQFSTQLRRFGLPEPPQARGDLAATPASPDGWRVAMEGDDFGTILDAQG